VKIDLTELLRQVGNEADINEEAKVSFPEDGLNLTRPVKIDLHLVNTGASVLVSGALATEAELECSRCLKKFKRPVVARVEEEYVRGPLPSPQKKGKETELKPDDFVYPLGPDETLDLGEAIRQNLMLALPIKPLCREACKGE
jgi:uncharacterized protein